MRALGLLLVVLCTACPQGPRYPATWQSKSPADGEAPIGAAEPATARPPTPQSEQAVTMHAWFGAIDAAEHAIVFGDPAAAREQGAVLAERLRGSLPPGAWVAIVSDITREAEALAHAETLDAAGVSVARLASRCGECHASMDVQPALPQMGEMPSRRPARDPGVAMKWHGWAAERMWEGLVGPSDDRWMRGTATFVELPGCGEPGTSAREDAVSERCRATRALAQRAHVAPTLTDRAEIHGKLLGTCAACHTAANVSQAAKEKL